MEHIVLPFGDRQTLFSCDSDGLTALESFPLYPLDHRVALGNSFLATFAACRSALIVQAWWPSGRVGTPEVVELPKGISGEAFLVTGNDELFVGGKSDRPWLGRLNLRDVRRTWVSMLPDEDLHHANEKGIDALSLTPYGDRLIAYDNLMLPLYAWIVDRSDRGWRKPKRIEIEPEYTYERIVSACAVEDAIYLLTTGVNHGRAMQFLRRFDRSAGKSELLVSESAKGSWSNDSEDGAAYGRDEEWLQVLATESGTVLIAAGQHGLGRFDSATAEMVYLGSSNRAARHIALIDNDNSVAVAFESDQATMHFRWEIDVYSTTDRSEFPRQRLNPRAGNISWSESRSKDIPQ